MKGLRRKFRRGLAGFLAFVLTMTSFNMVSWADVASAFETEKATFVMSGEEIRESAQAAIDSGSTFHFEDLGIEESEDNAKDYQKLFGSGSVYEIAPSYNMSDDEDADGADLRVFVRIKDDYEGYRLTGKEEIIFLYINDSEGKISFRTIVDGYATERITVKGNSKLAEAEVPGNVNGTLEGEVTTPEENGTPEGEVTTPEESGTPESEVTTPEENGTPESEVTAPEESGTPESEVTTPEENGTPEGEMATPEESGTPEGEVTTPEESGTSEGEVTTPEENRTPEGEVTTPEESGTPEGEVTTPEENRTPEEEVTTPEENGTLEGESDNEDAAMSEDNTVVSISRNSSAVLMSADSTVTVLESANEKNDKITLATASNSENSNSGKSDPKESSSVANLVNGKVYGNVILDESSYARAYVITLDALNIEQPLNEYQIKVTHRLHGDNWIDYEKIETVTITDNDFDNGEYDTAKLEFKREGIVLTSQSLVLTKDAFKSGTEAEITLEYAVADGYRIYDNRANLRSIFVGELDDDDPVIKPVGQAVVNIKYVYENGTIAKDTESVAALYDENTKKYKLTYELGDLDGYKPVLDTMDSASGITLDGNILTANLSEDKEYLAVIVYMADTVEYVVRHNYQKLDGSYEVKESETKSGKAGELSAAVAQNVTGFTPKQISQKELSATEENIVDIFYDRNIYDLTYSTDGGEYVERQTGLYGESLTVAKSTTKAGYLFDGWYTDKNFSQGTRVSGSIVLEDNTILYAKWNPGTVGYKVVYLIENADDNNYSLLCTDAKTGKTGDNVQITAKTANPTNWGELEKNAFTFKDSTSEVLKADGTSIVTVRYSRNTYTIRFQDKSPTLCRMESHTHTLSNCYKRTCNKLHKHNESCYDMSYTICGLTEHQHDSTCYTRDISAKYQANIREQWLENYGGHNWLWSGSSYTSLQDIMPYVSGNGIKVLNKHNDGPTPRPLEYYVEDPNGTIKDPKGGSTKFSLYTKITIYLEKGSTPSWDEEYYEIDGYERYYTNIDFSHPSFKNPSTFYYTRAKYDLTLINGTNETTKKDIPYKSDISKYLGAPTVKPTSDATFDAWYVDSSFTEKYTSGTMPKGNLVLYAHWNNAAYDVTFKDGQEILDTVEVNSGELVTPISTPEKAGYSFTGWYIDEACTQRYDFQRKVESDFDLYAGWSMHSTTSYQILYVTSEGDPVADSVTGNGVIGDTIQANAVVPTIAGYEDYIVDKATASISLDADPNKNVIRFIYSSPESLRYTVQYWYEDKIVAEEANIASKLSSFRCYPNTDLEQLTGYKVKEAYKNVKLTTGENIIKFTLTLNEYTITYENVDYNDIVWENGNTNPTKYNIRTNSFTLKNPGRVGYTFMGWKLVKGSVESGEYDSKNVVIETGSRGNLTFKAEWAVDVNQKLNYSIKYYKSEQPDKEIGNLNKNVLVASPTVKYADVDKTYNKPSGYILDKVEFGGQTVSDGEMTITDTDNIIKVYYKVDETQKLKYSVEYYIDGKDIPFDKLDNQEVLVADPVVSEVADSSKVPAGYTRDSVLPELPATISETANVIRVYYKVDETQKLKYSVEYYVTGNNTPFDKLENQEVLVADPVVKAVADSSKVPVGYTRDSVYPKLPVTISVSNNVIRVYYKVDETQKLKYSVEYYVTGNDTPFDKLENQEVLVADPVVKAVSDSSKVPAGYTRDSVLPELPATISETANVIKVYYRVDETQKLKYSVEYYINGNDTAFDKLENQEVLAADPVVKTVADSSKVPAGYRRDSVFPELPVTITESSNIIKVYYRIDTTQKLQFDVEYYLVGEMEAFDAVRNQTVLVANPVINAVADSSKVPAGYERAYVMPQLPTIISKTNNVIRVYYKVDETQKLKYSIEYYVNGNDTAFDKLENQEVLVANPVVSTVADSSKVPAGYIRDRVLPELPTTISGSNNVIRVYYKVDETQKLKYSVEYYLNGNDTAFDKLENQEVLVADPVVKAIEDSSKVPVGYTRDSVLPELPATISETANIIKVYYRVDETQKLKYSVEYYVTGNDTAFDKLENQEVLAADPVVKAVADSSKVPAGYTRDSVLPELPATISETANVIKVYYRVDETQKLKYSVEYYINGNDTAFDKLENQEVLVADPVVKTVADSSKVPAGYRRDSVSPELPVTITESSNIIKVYYRIDTTQKLQFDVEYYLVGEMEAFDAVRNQTVLVANPVINAVADSSKVPAGYERASVMPQLPTIISKTNNVIRVYYKVDETQKLKYSIEYYVTGNETAFDKLENQDVLVANPVVSTVADSSKVPAGYTRDRVLPELPTTISGSNNVIRVYYKVDETQKLKYSVEYYLNGNDTAFDKLENQEVLVADPVVKAVSDSSKVPVGYTRDSVLPELPATISETANVIKVYYRVDETQKLKYSVEYYVTGNDTVFDKLENQEVLAADPVVKAVADSSKVPAGYTRDSVSPKLPTTISSSNNIIRVYYKVDETQKLKYSVEYYVTGNDTAFDKLENQEVLVADPVVKAVSDSSKVPVGYTRDSVLPELPATISETANVIKVYYRVDETQKLKYSVEYYVNGNDTAFDKLENQEVLAADPVVKAVADSSKVPAGYTRDSVSPKLPTTISSSNNIIRVYYKVDETQKLKYSVEYYVTGNDTAFDKLENQEVLVADPVVKAVADSSKVPAGYTRDSVLPELPATISETANVIKVYYRVDETQKLKYSVEYYINGNDTAFDKLENQEVLAADPVVKAVADSSKVPAGYRRDSVSPELPVTITESSNIIKVYYRIDTTQKLQFDVEYYLVGEMEAFDAVRNQTVLVANPVINAVADSSKVPAGYERASVMPQLPTIISKTNNVIRVYYKVDETQKLKYSIEYYVTGNETAFDKLENQEVLVANPVVSTVADSSKVPAGYTRDRVLPELPTTISGSNNVIRVYYKVDETQKLKYSVEYYLNGNDTAFDKLENQEVLVADPVVKAVSDSSKVPVGYTRDSVLPELPATISETANVIKVYYRVDETQKLKYSVEYYVTGNDTAFDKLENQEVLAADPVVKAVADSSKVPAGYTRDSVSPKLPTTISSSNNIIRVYYKVDETQKLKYSVEYYVTGNDTAFDKLENQEVLVADPVVKAVSDSSKVPVGYTRDSVLPELPATISETANVIKVYYRVDETQKLKYSVEYYVNGNDTAFDKLENQEVLAADPVVKAVADSSKVPAGYTRDSVSPKLPTTISSSNNIIRVYYKVDETQKLKYSVEYYVTGNDTAFDKLENQEVLVADPVVKAVSDSSKVPVGYTRDSVLPELPATISETANVIKVYYRVDETQKLKYSVEYYVNGNDTAFDKLENQEVLAADPVVKAVADSSKVPAGYTRDSVSPKLPTTISSSNNIIRVYYKVDETQKLKYSVEYYVTGNDTAFDKLENQEVLVADPVVKAVADSSKVPAGYTRDSVLPELPATISETANVIKVYYRVDETQKLKYSIEYYVNGNDAAFDKLENQEVLVADPVVASVADSNKVPAGYTRDHVMPELPTTITESNHVIRVYYRVDETQKLRYDVEYYVDGNDTAFDKLENQEVLVANPVVNAVVDSSKVPAGYTRNSVLPELPTMISESNNIIKVYYSVDEMQKLKYNVEYYINGSATAFDKLENQEVLVADPYVLFVKDSALVSAGYVRDRVEPLLPAKIVHDGDIINVYYRARTDLYSEINYYYDDTKTDTQKDNNAVFDTGILDGVKVEMEVTHTDGKHYVLDRIEGKDKKVTVNPTENIVNIYYALDEKGTGTDPNKPDNIPDKYQITFTYVAGENGNVDGQKEEVITRELDADGSFSSINPAYPGALVKANANNGYSFQNWTSDEVGMMAGKPVSTFADEAAIREAGFITDTVFTAHFNAKEDTSYRIEYYYEVQGQYPATTNNYEVRTGKTDTTVSVTDNDKIKAGYKYDTEAANVVSGVVKGDNSLVLRLYFKQQFTVTYQSGNHDFFEEQVIGENSYGDKTPVFTGEMNIRGNYVFNGWQPVIAEKVTENAVYVAQWRYTGSSGGDTGGGGNTPSDNKPYVPNGPGDTVTIEPGDVPLANVPENGPVDNLMLIDDGNVPLAGLPKTGDRFGTNTGLAALLTGFLLAAFTALNNKRREEENK